MLKFLSKMERTRSLIIVGFAILMAVSLVVFYAPGRNAASRASTDTEVVASVGSDDITVGDMTSRLSANGADPSMLNRQLAELFLKQLIRERVIVQEAKRMGFTASDAEVAELIRENNKDSSGKVDVQRYLDRVGDVARYENAVRDEIIGDKLRAFITAGVTISDEELQKDFVRNNTSLSLVYVPVTADKLAAKINPTDQELRDYYEQHKTDYRILEEQKKIRYLFINQAKMAEKLQIPDADLRAEYDKLTPEQKQGGHHVQQIVLKVADPKLDATVKAKADDLAKQARGQTGTMTEEQFAELAKGHSEDPATAKNGGLVPGIVTKNPNKPDDPYQRTFETEEGGISGPIKYGNNYYILRRGASVPKTFEDARKELEVSLRNRKSYAAAAALAQKAADRVKETKDLQKVAQELAGEANMTPADMVRETPYVAPGDNVPNIGSSQQFEDAIKPLENPQDVGGVTPIKDGFAIPMLVDKKEPNRIPDFEEVKDKVLKDLRDSKAKAQLEETARNLANSTGSAADLKAAAEKLGLEAKTQDTWSINTPLGELEIDDAGKEAIFNLKEGEVAKQPIKSGNGFVVVGATKRTEADLTKFAQQRDTMLQSALTQKRNQIFEDFISAAQRRMESEGKIKIYQDVLARLGGGEEEPPPTITSPQIPQRPPARPAK